MSDSLWPHGLQHTKLPCPTLSPGVCSKSCPLSQWYHPTISFSVSPFSLSQHPSLFYWVSSLHQVARVLELQLQHQTFQWIFRVDFPLDWGSDLLAVQMTLNSLIQHHNSKASILCDSAFFMIRLSGILLNYWENHGFECMDLCWQSDVSVFQHTV